MPRPCRHLQAFNALHSLTWDIHPHTPCPWSANPLQLSPWPCPLGSLAAGSSASGPLCSPVSGQSHPAGMPVPCPVLCCPTGCLDFPGESQTCPVTMHLSDDQCCQGTCLCHHPCPSPPAWCQGGTLPWLCWGYPWLLSHLPLVSSPALPVPCQDRFLFPDKQRRTGGGC